MTIVFINPFFPPWVPGGAEHSLEQMCLHFSEQGWEVQVIAACFDDRPLDEERTGFTIRWIRAPFNIPVGQNIDVEDYFTSNGFRQSVFDRFKAIESPDIIIANNAQVYEIVAQIAHHYSLPCIGIVRDTQMLCATGTCMDNKSALEAVPCNGYLGAGRCVVGFHRSRGTLGWRPLPAWILKGFFLHHHRMKLRRVACQFDHIITISDALNHIVRKTLPAYSNDRISTVRNFFSQTEVADPDSVNSFFDKYDLIPGKFFLFAGKKTHGKGADLLVRATTLLRERVPGFHSLFLGRGSINQGENVGSVDVSSVPLSLLLGILKHSTALVIPGRWQEGLHRTMIDAIFAGVPVICTDAGAPPIDGVIDGQTGYVVPSNNVSALAEAMESTLNWTSSQRTVCREVSLVRFEANFETGQLMEQWKRVIKKVGICI